MAASFWPATGRSRPSSKPATARRSSAGSRSAIRASGPSPAGIFSRCLRASTPTTPRASITSPTSSPWRAIEAPAEEMVGVNSRAELAAAEALMQRRLRARAMENGVTLVDPDTVYFSADTQIGRDTVVGPFVVFGPKVTIGEGVEIPAFCHMIETRIGDRASVGPFARLRPGADLGDNVHIGNFVEVKNSRLEAGVKANHLTYLGDSTIGPGVNVGAGTITCNYDGFEKFRTEIGEGAFIGTNASLVAPVTIGAGAFIAAGSVITDDVPPDAMAVGRGAQVVKPKRAAEWRARRRAEKAAKQLKGKG